MNQKKDFILAVIIAAVLTVAVSAVYYFHGDRPGGRFDGYAESRQPGALGGEPQADLPRIFGLAGKEPGTQTYYSDQLGVGFTYRPDDERHPAISESGNKIMVGDQSVELFAKDPDLSLPQALQARFLAGYSPADCFVKVFPTADTEQQLPDYVAATISFPPSDNPDGPWWGGADKCPAIYTETNGLQYFLMNTAVPDKFLFVRIGQYAAVPDGTPRPDGGGFNWSHSLRILK
ncbi:MAG: hypothetical protein WC453_04440 [Patescibacteria group bacterium]